MGVGVEILVLKHTGFIGNISKPCAVSAAPAWVSYKGPKGTVLIILDGFQTGSGQTWFSQKGRRMRNIISHHIVTFIFEVAAEVSREDAQGRPRLFGDATEHCALPFQSHARLCALVACGVMCASTPCASTCVVIAGQDLAMRAMSRKSLMIVIHGIICMIHVHVSKAPQGNEKRGNGF